MLRATLVEKGDVAGSLSYTDFSALGSHAGLLNDAPMAQLEMRFMSSYASTRAAAALARIMDGAYRGGKGTAEIDGAEDAERAMTGEALGKYFQATGAVAAFQSAAAHIQENGPAEGLGDYDMTIRIAPSLKNDGKLVVKGAGPLLVFDNHASGATTGVSLNALAEGRLEVFAAYGGKSHGKLAFEADGTLADAGARGFASTIAFNQQFWVKELLAA
jgi:hypothetical protein